MAKLKQAEQLKSNQNTSLHSFVILLPLLVISLLYSTKAVDAVLLPKFVAFAVFTIFINALALKKALDEDKIAWSRYQSYLKILEGDEEQYRNDIYGEDRIASDETRK